MKPTYEELEAQVIALKEAIQEAADYNSDMVGSGWVFLLDDSILEKTPAQHLAERDAEIAANALEHEYKDLLHVVANQYDGNDTSEWSIGANHVFRLFTKEVCSRLEKLRQLAKEQS